MVETFEGQNINWSNFTAKDALEITKEAQKNIQHQEFINITKEIAFQAKLGQTELKLSKKLSDYTVSRLEENNFNVIVEKEQSYTIVTGGPGIKNDYWTTTIKW